MRATIVVLFAIVLSGCGPRAASPDSARTIAIEMRDFAFSPESLTLRGGERVTFVFKNVGKVEHEFMVGTDPMYGHGYMSDWLAGAYIAGESAHSDDHSGAGVSVAPNSTKTVTFVVPGVGGVFEFGCFVIGHYESGMRGRLVVDVASAGGAQASGRPAQSAGPTHAPMGDDDGEGH